MALLAAQVVSADEPVKAQPEAPAKAAAPKAPPPVDEDFLEFLANWDSEDETWNEYLASLAKDSKAKETGKTVPVKKPAQETGQEGK
jgi:hypothetical protein